MKPLNGKMKIGLCMTAGFAIVSAAFTAGMNFNSISVHTKDEKKHETILVKQARIDRSIAPIQKQLDRLEQGQAEIMTFLLKKEN